MRDFTRAYRSLVAIQEVLNKFYAKEWLRLEVLELLLEHNKGHETSAITTSTFYFHN